jgi:hypothetical protein
VLEISFKTIQITVFAVVLGVHAEGERDGCVVVRVADADYVFAFVVEEHGVALRHVVNRIGCAYLDVLPVPEKVQRIDGLHVAVPILVHRHGLWVKRGVRLVRAVDAVLHFNMATFP